MPLTPEISGNQEIRSLPGAFLQAFRNRVGSGLLSGRPHPRSNYRVTESGSDRLQVRAADWWTAINVGLNEVDLQVADRGIVSYQVRYWRWASFAIGISAMLGLIGAVLLLTFDVRTYIARESFHRLQGLSVDQNLLVLWGIVVFCGLIWPWLLIQLHKPFLQRLMRRLITEVDGG